MITGLNSSDDTGYANNDAITSATSIRVVGTTTSGSSVTVTLYEGNSSLGTWTGTTGSWSITVSSWSEGVHVPP